MIWPFVVLALGILAMVCYSEFGTRMIAKSLGENKAKRYIDGRWMLTSFDGFPMRHDGLERYRKTTGSLTIVSVLGFSLGLIANQIHPVSGLFVLAGLFYLERILENRLMERADAAFQVAADHRRICGTPLQRRSAAKATAARARL